MRLVVRKHSPIVIRDSLYEFGQEPPYDLAVPVSVLSADQRSMRATHKLLKKSSRTAVRAVCRLRRDLMRLR